jgi:RNA polymerase sigma factor (sigma-70 family)
MDNHTCAEQVCPAKYLCAQQGCDRCLEELLRAHDKLVKWTVSRQWRRCVAWDDLEQEGRMALWQAIVGYDVERGTAFSSYAVVAMERRIWRVVREAERERALKCCEEESCPSAAVEWVLQEQQGQVRALVKRLPLRLQRIVVQAYGLGAEPALSLAAIARQQGLSRERIRQLRNDALVHLRLQVLVGADVGVRLDRQRYRQLRQLNQVWLSRRRRGSWSRAG